MIDFKFKTFGNKQNQAIVMLHGFMGDSSDFDSLAKQLQDKYYCIAIDIPGHGLTKSSDRSDYTIEKISESLVQFLQNNKIQKPHLYGYSMGGRIALYLLTHYATIFTKAIIESALPGLKTIEEQTERIQKDLLLSKRMQMMPIEQFLEDWYNLELFSGIDKNSDKFHTMIARKSKNNIGQLVISLNQLGTGMMPSLWGSLHKISNDVLLLTGSIDKKYCNLAQEICSYNANFSHQIIDGTSHNVHFEQEETVLKLIHNFL